MLTGELTDPSSILDLIILSEGFLPRCQPVSLFIIFMSRGLMLPSGIFILESRPTSDKGALEEGHLE